MSAVGDARKRQDEAHAAPGATNTPNAAPSATDALAGSQGVEAIRARVEAATPGPWRTKFDPDRTLIGFDEPAGFFRLFEVRNWATPADVRFVTAARTDIPLLLAALDRVAAESEERLIRLQRREAHEAERLADEASVGDTGICRTCALPITYETVEEQGYKPRTGWSDHARSDALVCFKAVGYRHVPLVGRERGIWDAATKAVKASKS